MGDGDVIGRNPQNPGWCRRFQHGLLALSGLILVLFTSAVQAEEHEPSWVRCLLRTSVKAVLEETQTNSPIPSCGGALSRPGGWDFSYDPFDNIKSIKVAHQRMREEDGSWRDLYATYWLFIEFPSGRIVSLPFEATSDTFALSVFSLGPGWELIMLTRWTGTGTGYASHRIELWRALSDGVEKVFDTKFAEFITRTPQGEHFYLYYEVYLVKEEQKEEHYSIYRTRAIEMQQVMRGVPQDLRQDYNDEFAPVICLRPMGERIVAVAQDCETAWRAAGK